MNTFENLDPKEKIIAFIDGELDPSESSNLFYELASNPHLQEEMQKQMLMKNLFKNGLVMPPPNLKNAVLRSTGLLHPSYLGRFALLGLLALLLKNKWAIVSIAALITAGTLYFGYNHKAELSAPNKMQTAMLSPNPPVSYSIESNDNTLVAESNKKSKYVKNTSNRNTLAENNGISASKGSKLGSNEIAKDDLIEHQKNFGENNTLPLNVASVYGMSPNFSFKSKNITNSKSLNFFNQLNLIKDVTLEFRLFNSKSYPWFDLKPLSNPIVNDFAIAVLFSIDQRNSLGIEFGQEDFLQEFTGVVEGQDIKYQQIYNTGWGGIAFQRTLNTNFGIEGFEPYYKVLIGATKVGPLGKATAGARYYINENVALSLGFEPSILFYSYGNTIFTTRKLGITYGLQMKL